MKNHPARETLGPVSRIRRSLLAGVLAAAAAFCAPGVAAATFTFTNLFGGYPYAGLILSGSTLYGTANIGGNSGNGTVFALGTNGTGFSTLHSFAGGTDGANPNGGLLLSGNMLYGTTYGGGSAGNGTVFSLHTDGTGFTVLHSFTAFDAVYYTRTNGDGAHPYAGLILSGNTLYGTTYEGGASGNGTVFSLQTDGTGFTTLHSFTYGLDGANPTAALVLSGNTLYGTTPNGGVGGDGTLFALQTDGTGFTNLHHFTACDVTYYTNRDGANPSAGLMLSGNALYGTAENGGRWGAGTVFALHTDGTGFTNLYHFTAYDPLYCTNSDGANPVAGLIVSGNLLYGTAYGGGNSGNGTVFALHTDGTSFTNLHNFTAYLQPDYTNSDGANPSAALVLSGSTLYGTAYNGGMADNGTVFSFPALAPPTPGPIPSLTIRAAGTTIVLTWPADATGFTLQSTTNLGSPVSWAPVATAPVIVNGQNTVSNAVSGTRQFYRLRLNQ